MRASSSATDRGTRSSSQGCAACRELLELARLADDLDIPMVVFTRSGSSAQRVSATRPLQPVHALTPNTGTARRLERGCRVGESLFDRHRFVVVSTDFDNVRRLHKRARWNRLADSVAHTRTWGDGYGHLLVASGRAHVVADPIMNPWDLVPVVPVLKGAGAVVTDWQGKDAVASGNVIAAAPKLHAQVLAALND